MISFYEAAPHATPRRMASRLSLTVRLGTVEWRSIRLRESLTSFGGQKKTGGEFHLVSSSITYDQSNFVKITKGINIQFSFRMASYNTKISSFISSYVGHIGRYF